MYQPSLVKVITEKVNGGGKCGYCKKPDTHYLEGGIWTYEFTPQDEQYLIEHSWRRCGQFIYLLDKTKNCCPLYMIRCDAENFKLSHSQKRVLRRMTSFLKGSTNPEKDTIEPPKISIEEKAAPTTGGACKIVPDKEKLGAQESEQAKGASPLKKMPKQGVGADPNKAPCIKSKERKKQKMLAKQENKIVEGANAIPKEKSEAIKPKENESKPLKDHITEHQYRDGYAHKLETRLILVNPESKEYKATEAESHRIYELYQQKVHGDKPGVKNLSQYKGFLVTSAVHPHQEIGDMKYGCYHLQYFIDGKLFMVGVLDILPNYVSSVYTYYDPDFMFLSPGVYSALAEINLTQKLQEQSRIKKWYCLGYFIYNNPKMRYKGEYTPSYLNCPYTHNWIPYKECLPKLQTGTYQKLDAPDKMPVTVDITKCLVLSGGNVIQFSALLEVSDSAINNIEKVQKYCEQVGPDFYMNAVAVFDFL